MTRQRAVSVETLRPSRRSGLGTVIRAFAMLLVALGSLQLALLVAHAVWLVRQGKGSVADVPAMIAWLVVIAIGLAAYAHEARIRTRVRTALRRVRVTDR